MTVEDKLEIMEWMMWSPVIFTIILTSIELIVQKVQQRQYAREAARHQSHRNLIKIIDKLDLVDDETRDGIIWYRYLYERKTPWWKPR